SQAAMWSLGVAPTPIRPLAFGYRGLQLGAGWVVGVDGRQGASGVQAGLVGLGEADLVVLGEQGMAADLVQVQPEQVKPDRLTLALHACLAFLSRIVGAPPLMLRPGLGFRGLDRGRPGAGGWWSRPVGDRACAGPARRSRPA